jgi:hypothetical protein
MTGEPSPAVSTPAQTQEFDIQHDDEFEDFHVSIPPPSDSGPRLDLAGDWDDDVVEDFSAILQEQRSLLQ